LHCAGRFEEAVAQYDFFVAHHVKDPDLLVGLGLAGVRRQELPRDIPLQNRQFLLAVGNAGYAYLSGDFEEASKQFNELFAHYPATPNLYFFYGSLLYRDSPTQAIEEFFRRRNAPHIADHRLHDQAGDLLLEFLECIFEGVRVVVWQGERELREFFGNARRAREPRPNGTSTPRRRMTLRK